MRPHGFYAMLEHDMFQSTHPCGVRPTRDDKTPSELVSIHAPVWGATGVLAHTAPFKGVSIHAPVWGATGVLAHTAPFKGVSIHAPVWGAT